MGEIKSQDQKMPCESLILAGTHLNILHCNTCIDVFMHENNSLNLWLRGTVDDVFCTNESK